MRSSLSTDWLRTRATARRSIWLLWRSMVPRRCIGSRSLRFGVRPRNKWFSSSTDVAGFGLRLSGFGLRKHFSALGNSCLLCGNRVPPPPPPPLNPWNHYTTAFLPVKSLGQRAYILKSRQQRACRPDDWDPVDCCGLDHDYACLGRGTRSDVTCRTCGDLWRLRCSVHGLYRATEGPKSPNRTKLGMICIRANKGDFRLTPISSQLILPA